MIGARGVSHPIVVLRRLRAGVLAMVAVTTLLYLVVANRAGDQLAASERTLEAIDHIRQAQGQAVKAKAALDDVSEIDEPGAISLTGTGADFANATARVSSHLTSATEGNGAGEEGLSHIQFVQGQLATSVRMANTAVLDGAPAVKKVGDALDDPKCGADAPAPFTCGLKQSLKDLEELENEAAKGERTSGWCDRALLWPLFMGPPAVMLLLVGATGRIVVQRFRRYPSPALVLALLATASISVLMCVSPALTMAIALPVLAASGALAYLAYRPRLAEYRFPRS
ncbi:MULTISPECIES: hypothetical protein [unclassified Streptomyces]|uniref:hypothetical protein n=1 Tax=unclassified Streptomyces TaxID=2593676 RepID=UPI0033AB3B2C